MKRLLIAFAAVCLAASAGWVLAADAVAPAATAVAPVAEAVAPAATVVAPAVASVATAAAPAAAAVKPAVAAQKKAVKAKVAPKKAAVKAKVAEKKEAAKAVVAAVKGIEAPGPAIIKQVAKPPANDGSMASFAEVPSIRLSAANPVHLAGGAAKSDAELSGDLRLATDGKNLYIACEVTQGRGPVNKQGFDTIWNGDALELYLSSKSGMLKTSRMKKSEWDFQVLLVPTSAKGPIIRGFGIDLKGAEMKAVPTAKGYVVTGVVPLSNFKDCDWAPGKSYKFDAALAKAGPAGVRVDHLFWNATIDAYDNPDMWGVADVK